MANKAEAAIALQGYMHNQAPQFNVRDLLLSSDAVNSAAKQGVGLMQAEGDRQAKAGANAYVSELLGKTNKDNYQENLLKAGAMSPYASPELMKQVSDTRGQMQYDQGVATHALERGQDVKFRTDEFTQKQKEHLDQIEEWGQQHKLTREQIDAQKTATALQYKVGMAGVGAQYAGIAMQGKQLNAQIDNNKFLRAGTIMGAQDNGYDYKDGKFVRDTTVGATFDAKGNKQMSPYEYKVNIANNKTISDARMLLDPENMLSSRSSKNSFGGLFELDSTSLEPLNRVSSALGSQIPARDAEHWRQLIISDPKRASELLDDMKVPK